MLPVPEFSDNEKITSSIIIADVFRRPHRNVMKAIKDLDCSDDFRVRNFTQSSYKSLQNKELPCFKITYQGALYLCTGFTGAKSSKAREEIISGISNSSSLSRTLDAIKNIEIDRDLFVYVMSCNGSLKVGVSSDPETRVKQLQTGSAHPIKLEFFVSCEDAFKVESAIHSKLKSICISGEWFNEEISVLNEVKEQANIRGSQSSHERRAN